MDVIADWCATEQNLASLTLLVFLLAGEQDFVTLRSMDGWQQLVQLRGVVIPGAAHHALLEMPGDYGACLEGFSQEHEAHLINNG